MNIFDFNRFLVVYIGSTQIACKMNNRDNQVILQSLDEQFEPTIDADKIKQPLEKILTEAVKQFKFQAVNVILADPILMQINIDLQTVPKNQKRLHALIMVKVEKDYQLAKKSYTFSIQNIKNRGNSNRFIVYAIQNELLGVIQQSVEEQNKILREVIPSYQLLHNTTLKKNKDGRKILLYLDKESWTLSILDNRNEILFLRSKWHTDNIGEIFDSLSVIFRSLSSNGISSDFNSATFVGSECYNKEVSEYLNSIINRSTEKKNKKTELAIKIKNTHSDLIYTPMLAYK